MLASNHSAITSIQYVRMILIQIQLLISRLVIYHLGYWYRNDSTFSDEDE
jgi:hypothetical protein